MYILSDVSHFTWNIVVPKMYKLVLKIFKIPLVNTSIIIFDGPDVNSNEVTIGNEEKFTPSFFQVLILYLHLQNKNVKITFTNNVLKDKIENHHNVYKISEGKQLNSEKFNICTAD